MFPIGQYERLVQEIKHRENKEIPVTFGILIADFHQQNCKEYILNYIDRFNYKSDQYINFYLPGYLDENLFRNNEKITINKKEYFFNRELYLDFLRRLESDFDIEYPYNPVLILMEYDKGNFKKSRKIIIELDSNGSDIKQVGRMFEEIFNIAKQFVSIDDFSKKLVMNEIKNDLFGTIIEGIDISYLTVIYNKAKEVYKYRLKKAN